MKKYINIFLVAILALVFGACSKESPFDNLEDLGTGSIRKSSLDVSVAVKGPRSLRNRSVRQATPDASDFTVDFIRKGTEETVIKSYLYSEMPEIVTLPVGDYIARAHFGTNPDAAWEQPYYKGESDFQIIKDQITENIEPIECVFANIRVSIDFSPTLRASMGSNAKVTVKVGESGTLDFTINDVERSGYFAYVPDSHTLVATFTGLVDDVESSITKSFDDVEAGMHYHITFNLFDAGEEDPGEITGTEDGLININASVETTNMNSDVETGEEGITDDLRPSEGKEDPKPDDPQQPVEPGKDAPTIEGQAPLDIDKVIKVTSDGQTDYPVILNIHSSADNGIQEFTVTIDSPTLVPLLEELGVKSVLNIADSGDDAEFFDGLGLEYNVRGRSDVKFDISGFLPLLPDGTHKFIIFVSDANGQQRKTVELQK